MFKLSVYNLKPRFQALLQPVIQHLAAWKVTPNQVTVAAFGLSVCGGWAFYEATHVREWLWAIPLVLLVRMALNAIDGQLARLYNQSSVLGEILNEAGDVLSDMVLYAPLLLWVPAGWEQVWVGLFLFLSVFTEFCGILGKAMTGVRRYDGPMGKSDRAFWVSLYAIALALYPDVQVWGSSVFAFMSGLLIASCWNRLMGILSTENSR